MMQKLPITTIILANEHSRLLPAAMVSAHWSAQLVIAWCSEQPVPQLSEDVAAELQGVQLQWLRFPRQITDFAAVRNQAAGAATQEILFYLDSDEVVHPDSYQAFADLVTQTDWQGLTVKRQDLFIGKILHWGEVGNVQLLRIFRKNAFQFVRPVHEVAEVDGFIWNSGVIITHAAHDSISSFWTKICTYLQLEVRLRWEEGEQVSVWHLLCWPTGKFLQNYILRLGVLDGWRGFIYALLMSVHSFGVRASLYERQHVASA